MSDESITTKNSQIILEYNVEIEELYNCVIHRDPFNFLRVISSW